MIIRLLFFFLLFCNTIYSQSVYTALNINNPEKLRPEFLVEEITTEMIFYNKNNIEQKKEISKLNAQHNIISELRYDEQGNLTARLTRVFDSTGTRSLGRKLEKWHRIMGYSYEISKHEYDANGYLIRITEKNQHNNIIMITTIKNDEKGNPIEVMTTNGKNEIYGIEKAEYDYTTNTVSTRVYNKNNEMVSENSRKISYTDTDDNSIIKNEHGDVILSGDTQYEYQYDKKGNWIKMTRFEIKNDTRIKMSVFTRRLKYKKN
jgi:hypothetical protein